MAELKPCPFCGGVAKEPYHYDPYDGYQGDCGSYIIRCGVCGANVSRRKKEDVILSWNRRADNGT